MKLKDVGMSSTEVRAMERDELATLEPVQQQLIEAQAQLAHYHTLLQKKYGEQLRLRCIAIVAVGYERLIDAE